MDRVFDELVSYLPVSVVSPENEDAKIASEIEAMVKQCDSLMGQIKTGAVLNMEKGQFALELKKNGDGDLARSALEKAIEFRKEVGKNKSSKGKDENEESHERSSLHRDLEYMMVGQAALGKELNEMKRIIGECGQNIVNPKANSQEMEKLQEILKNEQVFVSLAKEAKTVLDGLQKDCETREKLQSKIDGMNASCIASLEASLEALKKAGGGSGGSGGSCAIYHSNNKIDMMNDINSNNNNESNNNNYCHSAITSAAPINVGENGANSRHIVNNRQNFGITTNDKNGQWMNGNDQNDELMPKLVESEKDKKIAALQAQLAEHKEKEKDEIIRRLKYENQLLQQREREREQEKEKEKSKEKENENEKTKDDDDEEEEQEDDDVAGLSPTKK